MCQQLHNWAPMIVSVVLEVLVTFTMFITSTVDPGIIPANVSDSILTSEALRPDRATSHRPEILQHRCQISACLLPGCVADLTLQCLPVAL